MADELSIRSLHLTSESDARTVLEGMKVDPVEVGKLLPKMFWMNILLSEQEGSVAAILKREMHSAGGDAAVAGGVISGSAARTDVLLTGTLAQMRRFAETISLEPIGLTLIARRILWLLENSLDGSLIVRTSRREIALGERTLIMGILNVTPDSFSDGGRFKTADEAVEEGLKMVEDGADIIDVGGESTRPGSDAVSAEEELQRVIPVIRALACRTKIPLCVDTMKSPVARAAAAEGAEIINDVSAMGFDPAMAGIIAETGVAIVLMHMRGFPKSMQAGDLTYRSVRGEIIDYLRERIRYAGTEGIDFERIMIDPGIGFGKTAEDNMRLIKHLREFESLGRPVLIGTSRKAFIGRVTGGLPAERGAGTAATVTAAILNGAAIVRVHDVAMMKKVAAMADAVMRA